MVIKGQSKWVRDDAILKRHHRIDRLRINGAHLTASKTPPAWVLIWVRGTDTKYAHLTRGELKSMAEVIHAHTKEPDQVPHT